MKKRRTCRFGRCGDAATPTPEAKTLTGDLRFWGVGESYDVEGCVGALGTPYVSIEPGTQVLLKDGSGNTVGVGSLVEAPDSGREQDSGGRDICHYEFELRGVTPAAFYEISIGSLDGPAYSAEQLDEQGWHVSLG